MASGPPLPARQRSQHGAPRAPYKDGHNTQKPELRQHPSVRTNNNVTYVPLGHSSNNGQTKYKYTVEPPVGGASQEPPPPPRPPKPNGDVPHRPTSKRSVETASFIERNTARIYSDPGHVSQPPAEPSRTRTVQKPQQIPDDDVSAPPPPVSRPPRGPPKQHDFESRFRFHDLSDFPDPEFKITIDRKEYPSLSFRRKQQEHSRRQVTIDAL